MLSKFYPPTKGKPQRLQVDSDGIVWFTERQGNKIGRLDPKTGDLQGISVARDRRPVPMPSASIAIT